MPGELSREEKRAIRKAEKRKAKFGTEVAADAPKGSSESTQQQQQGLLSGGDVDINDAAKVRITPPTWTMRNVFFCKLNMFCRLFTDREKNSEAQ